MHQYPEIVDFKQSELLKQIRIYQQTYADCDPDRVVIQYKDNKLQKQDIDKLLLEENYTTSANIMDFYLNYIISHLKSVYKTPPYFIIIQTQESNPKLNNITLYQLKLQQSTLAQFKYKPSTNQILILINCQNKWFLTYIDLLNWIIDYKYDQYTDFKQTTQFLKEFLEDSLNIQETEFNDYMVNMLTSGDCGDQVLYTIYKIFVANQKMSDDFLSLHEIHSSKKKLLWFLLRLMKTRTKQDDDEEFQKRVQRKQMEEYKKKLEEQEELVKQIQKDFKKKEPQIITFGNDEQQYQQIQQENKQEIAGVFNISRVVTKLESFLTRHKITEKYNFNYPSSENRSDQPIKKDPRAKVKRVVPYFQQVSQSQINAAKQILTPASFQISSIFNTRSLPQMEYRVIHDRKIEQYNKEQKQKIEQMLEPIQGQYTFELGQHAFDNRLYEQKKQIKSQAVKKTPQVQLVKPTIDQIDEEIARQEQQLIRR